jgi:protocatechuate 3,4-dioxygenase beta subunit
VKNALIRIAILMAMAHLLPRPITAAETVAANKMRPITVRVLDESGVPIAGAKVHRSVWTEAKFPPNADFLTDAQGTVSFELPAQVSILRLWATHKGRVPMFANFDARQLGGDPVPKDYTFTLPPGTSIGGFVHDDIGAPIPGAKVEVQVDSREPGMGGIGQAVVDTWLAFGKDSCITDEHGFWAVNNVPAGPDWRIGLRLRHPDHVDDLEWRGLRGPPFSLQQFRDQSAITVMQTGVRVTGTITGPDGKPVPKALVIWGDRPYHNTNVQETFTDEAGRYQLPPLMPGKTLLTVIAKGYAPVLREIQLVATPQVENVQLEPGRTITFRFVDAAGKPVPRMLVHITGWRGKETLINWKHSNVPYSKIPDEADDQGIYTWTWAPDDAVDYLFEKRNLKWTQRPTYSPGEHEIIVGKDGEP